mgnify:CR=1 FL=1
MEYTYVAIIRNSESGGYRINFPDLRGCLTRVEHESELMSYAMEILSGYIKARIDNGEDFPEPRLSLEEISINRKISVTVNVEDTIQN